MSSSIDCNLCPIKSIKIINPSIIKTETLFSHFPDWENKGQRYVSTLGVWRQLCLLLDLSHPHRSSFCAAFPSWHPKSAMVQMFQRRSQPWVLSFLGLCFLSIFFTFLVVEATFLTETTEGRKSWLWLTVRRQSVTFPVEERWREVAPSHSGSKDREKRSGSHDSVFMHSQTPVQIMVPATF